MTARKTNLQRLPPIPTPDNSFHNQKTIQLGSRPISRVLCITFSGNVTVIPLGMPLPTRSSNLPGSDASHAMLPYLVLLRMGFTVPSDVDPGRGELLPHPFTLTWRLTPSAVCFLLPAMMRRDKPESDTHHYCPLLPVGLSVTLRCPAVSRHPALRSPDFPPRIYVRSDCLGDFPRLLYVGSHTVETTRLIRRKTKPTHCRPQEESVHHH